jgi:predicted CopG family antitoxin
MRTPRGREVTEKAYKHLVKLKRIFKEDCFSKLINKEKYSNPH